MALWFVTMFVSVFDVVANITVVVLMMLVMCVRVTVNNGLVLVFQYVDVLLRPEP